MFRHSKFSMQSDSMPQSTESCSLPVFQKKKKLREDCFLFILSASVYSLSARLKWRAHTLFSRAAEEKLLLWQYEMLRTKTETNSSTPTKKFFLRVSRKDAQHR